MKLRRVMLALLMCASVASWAPAQEPQGEAAGAISLGELQVTPEMWFYEQEMRRYSDPRQMVRAKAEFRSQQRQHRLAALHWFGYSNSRPVANMTPTCGQYQPCWVGNSATPFHWRGVGGTPVVVSRANRVNAPATGLW